MTPLPQAFLRAPLAHRGYHDRAAGRPENSLPAILAAVEAGYGIEIDVQLTADGRAVVFHDYDLGRLTGISGPVRGRSEAELTQIALTGGQGTTIPTLSEVLAAVAGRVPLLIEVKDQDGGMGPDVGPLETAVAHALRGYDGPVAMMSFNPHSVAAFARAAPEIPRGLVTSDYRPDDWPLSAATCDRLREIPDAERLDIGFISHEARDLGRERVADLKAAGLAVLCWTIRSPEAEAAARRVAQNVTFEGYVAAIPA